MLARRPQPALPAKTGTLRFGAKQLPGSFREFSRCALRGKRGAKEDEAREAAGKEMVTKKRRLCVSTQNHPRSTALIDIKARNEYVYKVSIKSPKKKKRQPVKAAFRCSSMLALLCLDNVWAGTFQKL